MAKIVTIANNKGGVAKTTTVLALAQAWANNGLRVLAVDLDSQGNLTTILSPLQLTEHRRTIREALLEKKDIPIEQISENLFLTPATLTLAKIENEMVTFYSRENILKSLLANVSDDYDIIILDCPPALGLMTFSALMASDSMVVPLTADSLSFSGFSMITDLAETVREYNPSLKLKGVVVTRFKSDKISNTFLEVIKNSVGSAFVEPVIHEATKIKQAILAKESFYDFDPKGRATQDYFKVAEELQLRILG